MAFEADRVKRSRYVTTLGRVKAKSRLIPLVVREEYTQDAKE
jgi:hypothetical protein